MLRNGPKLLVTSVGLPGKRYDQPLPSNLPNFIIASCAFSVHLYLREPQPIIACQDPGTAPFVTIIANASEVSVPLSSSCVSRTLVGTH